MDRKFNQRQFSAMVAAESHVPAEDVSRVLRAVFDVIGRTVAEGDTIAVTNFGTWGSVVHPARMHRNPQNGEAVQRPETRRPVFRYSPAIKEAARSGEVPETFKKLGHGRLPKG